MKKRKAICILLVMLLLTGCAKCLTTTQSTVEVEITDAYYRGAWIQPILCGKTRSFITHPAVYHITVEYDEIEYTISGSETYYKYKDCVGERVNATLEIREYDNGTVRREIVGLE